MLLPSVCDASPKKSPGDIADMNKHFGYVMLADGPPPPCRRDGFRIELVELDFFSAVVTSNNFGISLKKLIIRVVRDY